MTSFISQASIKAGMSYEEYRGLIEQLLLGGKTTGDNQSMDMIDYTRRNAQRMNRLDDKIKIHEELEDALNAIQSDWYWIILTEAWCGEAAQNIPILSKIARKNSKITMKLLLRDEEPEIMEKYFPEESQLIPKLICVNKKDFSDVGIWGPRPQPVQQIIDEYKDKSNKTQEEFIHNVQEWYLADKGNTIQEEMTELITDWINP